MSNLKLKEIADIITGFPFKGNRYSDIGIRTVRGENVTEGRLRWDTTKCWNQKFEKEKFYLLKTDDVVIGMDGSKVGKNKARIKNKDLPLLLAQRVACVRAKENNHQVYIYYLINNPRFESYVFQTQTGSSVPHISKTQIEDFPVPRCTYKTQQKIATILSALDDKIEVNNQINTKLEAMAKTIYDYWFVQFDFPFDFAQGKPTENEDLNENGTVAERSRGYKSSGGKMVFNETLKRKIPIGWEVKRLESCIDKIIDYRGRTPKKLDGDWSENMNDIIALSAKHVKGGKLVNLNAANRVDDKLYHKWMKEKLHEGDIIMTSEAPCGEFFYLVGKTKYCLSQRVFAIRANSEVINHACLYYELSIGNGYSQIMGKVSGSTVFGIRQDELRTVNVLIPGEKSQNDFQEKIVPVYQKIRINQKQNQELAQLRDWLLPMLMNGQVRVDSGEYESEDRNIGQVEEEKLNY